MTQTVVDKLFQEYADLVSVVNVHAEPSSCVTANECFRKALLLSAASHFENVVVECIVGFCREASAGNVRVEQFVRKKALARQFHTLFDWDAGNANRFFSFFGAEFQRQMDRRCDEDAEFRDAVRAFVEIGRERNRLVHQDFGTYPLEKTAEEIYDLYKRATCFVDELPALLTSETPTQWSGNDRETTSTDAKC